MLNVAMCNPQIVLIAFAAGFSVCAILFLPFAYLKAKGDFFRQMAAEDHIRRNRLSKFLRAPEHS